MGKKNDYEMKSTRGIYCGGRSRDIFFPPDTHDCMFCGFQLLNTIALFELSKAYISSTGLELFLLSLSALSVSGQCMEKSIIIKDHFRVKGLLTFFLGVRC